MPRKKQLIEEPSRRKDVTEELTETIDDLFRYFDLTDESHSELPYIGVETGRGYAQGVVDTELHEILMRMYELMQASQD